MGLLDRVAAEQKNLSFGGGQGFSEPNLWDLDPYRSSLLSNTTPDKERIENDFEGYVQGAYKGSGVIFTCIDTRQNIFSQAPAMWQRLVGGRPGELFSTPELEILKTPWQGGTLADLLTRMEVDLSLAGNFFATLADDSGRMGRAATGPGRRVSVLRPDWVTIIVSSSSGDPRAVDAHPVGYLYEPPLSGGTSVRSQPVVLMPDEVCHYSVVPDPTARYRGMSWLTPVLKEISSDRAATTHKKKFFENGATLTHAVSLDKEVPPAWFDEFVERFKQNHQGTENAYKTLFLGGGADVTTVGADLRQLDFKATQGHGESRIAAASGVGSVIAQFSEGMQGSSLNAGNYMASRRRVADVLFRRLWAGAFAALAVLAPPPNGTRLWYDASEIPFLQEDESDAAEIQGKEAATIRTLIDAGYEPGTVSEAVRSSDWSRLRHSGLYSVQLQPPNPNQTPDSDQSPSEED